MNANALPRLLLDAEKEMGSGIKICHPGSSV